MAHRDLSTDVIRRARRGDHAAFRQVVERYQAGVFRLAYKMTSDHAKAADLAQETFLRVYRFFGKFDVRRPLTPWIYKVATNVVLNHVKTKRPEPVSLDAIAGHEDREPRSRSPQASDMLAQQEARHLVREAVAELKPHLRATVALYYLDELSLREAADALAVPEATAKVWLFRGRRALKKTLERMRP